MAAAAVSHKLRWRLPATLTSAAAGVAVAFTVAGTARADDAAARHLVRLFAEVCLRSLTEFGPAVDELRARGFELTEAGSNRMYEVWDPRTSTGGYVAPGRDRHEERGCGVSSESTTRKPVVELVAALLRTRSDVSFGAWSFGDPSLTGWRAEVREGHVFVVVGPGPSDRPDRGVSVHVDFQRD